MNSTDSSIWGQSWLIYAGLVALIVVVALIARTAGVFPLHDPERSLDPARGWNPPATQFHQHGHIF